MAVVLETSKNIDRNYANFHLGDHHCWLCYWAVWSTLNIQHIRCLVYHLWRSKVYNFPALQAIPTMWLRAYWELHMDHTEVCTDHSRQYQLRALSSRAEPCLCRHLCRFAEKSNKVSGSDVGLYFHFKHLCYRPLPRHQDRRHKYQDTRLCIWVDSSALALAF